MGKSKGKKCPNCGKTGFEGFHLKRIRSKGKDYYYYYGAHYRGRERQNTPTWCYVGKTLPAGSGKAKKAKAA